MSKLAYTYEEAAEETGLTVGVLRAAVKSSDLIAATASERNPIILHKELERYLENLPPVAP